MITTGDIERDFALERRLFPHKSHCNNRTRFRLMRLASGSPSTYKSEDLKWVLGRAQELWARRHSEGTRQLRTFDARKGQKQKQSGGDVKKVMEGMPFFEGEGFWGEKELSSVPQEGGRSEIV